MKILFFDTYIIGSDKNESGGINNNIQMSSSLSITRERSNTYRWQNKINIVKYTLASYAMISWDEVIIRYECEDASDSENFQEFCQDLFPSAFIQNFRSSTIEDYRNAFSSSIIRDDDWVFYSPNNDHPYIAKPGDIENVISSANLLAEKYKKVDIGIIFSHYTESQLDRCMGEPLWGHLGENFKRKIFEDQFITATLSNKLCIDSVQIFKAKFLRGIFQKSLKAGRVIRLEDTEFYLSRAPKGYIQVVPKVELCRHYDGYYHFFDPQETNICLPLFIPEGFFDKKIKIRYGYEGYIDGWVNINPLKNAPLDCDLSLLLDDIPYFWRDRILNLDKNQDFVLEIRKEDLPYYKNLKNPFKANNLFFNYFRSFILTVRYVLAVTFARKLKRYIKAHFMRSSY